MKLAVDLSNPLVALLEKNQVPIDYIEFGPWFSPAEITGWGQKFPAHPFIFHAGEQVYAYSRKSADLPRLQQYLDCSETPWLSVHLTFMSHFRARLAYLGIRLPDRPPKVYAQRFIERCSVLAEQIDVPIIIENMGMLPQGDPEWIKMVLQATGCKMLLDLSHARVAAQQCGWSDRQYLAQLPLEKVIAIHVSGSRLINNHRLDAHESLMEADYALLEWTLERTRPEILTLEYVREPQTLRAQIERLAGIVRRYNEGAFYREGEGMKEDSK